MAEQYRNFKRIFWVQKEDNVHTVGLNEDALDEFEKITSIDLPAEGEVLDSGSVCGSIETDAGSIDIYSPVSGTLSEINSLVLEEPSLIQDDPYDAWLFKIESEEDLSDDDDGEGEEDEEDDEESEDDESDDEEEEDEEDY